MRPRRPDISPSGIEPNLHRQNGESKPAGVNLNVVVPVEKRHRRNGAKDVLKLERARQRTAIGHMQATRGEMALTTKVLLELLSDPAFVALLRAEGSTSIPKLLHQRLVERR